MGGTPGRIATACPVYLRWVCGRLGRAGLCHLTHSPLEFELGLEVDVLGEGGPLALDQRDEALDQLGVELAMPSGMAQLGHSIRRSHRRAEGMACGHRVVRAADRK